MLVWFDYIRRRCSPYYYCYYAEGVGTQVVVLPMWCLWCYHGVRLALFLGCSWEGVGNRSDAGWRYSRAEWLIAACWGQGYNGRWYLALRTPNFLGGSIVRPAAAPVVLEKVPSSHWVDGLSLIHI